MTIFGHTAGGLPIPAFQLGSPSASSHVLLLGGVHGDEKEGVIAAYGLWDALVTQFPYKNLTITLIPTFNLDGVLANNRLNAHGVDLNRNLPTQDWNPLISQPRYHPGPTPNSEPENQALVQFLEQTRPNLIISLHSWHPLLNVNGACLDEAHIIHEQTLYRIEETVGYPTPGCLGTYAGLERGLPTLTYEIERGLAPKTILAVHVPAILAALKVTEKKNVRSK